MGAPGPWGGEEGGFEFGGVPLQVKPSYKYLGLTFEDGGTPKQMLTRAVEKARGAMRTMFGKCYKLQLHNPNVQGHLFDSLIKPLLCYGCEVWGPDLTSSACKAGGNLASGAAEVEVHKAFMRQSLGVGLNTPAAALMHELGRQPVMIFWLRMAAQLWNRALQRDSTDYLALALRDNLELAMGAGLTTAARRGLWGFQFTRCLDELGVDWGAPGGLKLLDTKALVRAAEGSWEAHENKNIARAADTAWRGKALAVRAAPESFSAGFMALTYQQWFRADTWVRKESFTYHLHRQADIKAVAKFRVGMHCLNIREGRLAKVRRHERLCPCCKGGVEDEMHMMMECPAYDRHRAANQALCARPEGGWSDAAFRERMNGATRGHWEGLADFIGRCMETRVQMIEQQNSARATN
jgi:hypothetical protein